MGKLKENYKNNKFLWWWLVFLAASVTIIQFTAPMIPLTGMLLTIAFFMGRWSIYHEDAKKVKEKK